MAPEPVLAGRPCLCSSQRPVFSCLPACPYSVHTYKCAVQRGHVSTIQVHQVAGTAPRQVEPVGVVLCSVPSALSEFLRCDARFHRQPREAFSKQKEARKIRVRDRLFFFMSSLRVAGAPQAAEKRRECRSRVSSACQIPPQFHCSLGLGGRKREAFLGVTAHFGR